MKTAPKNTSKSQMGRPFLQIAVLQILGKENCSKRGRSWVLFQDKGRTQCFYQAHCDLYKRASLWYDFATKCKSVWMLMRIQGMDNRAFVWTYLEFAKSNCNKIQKGKIPEWIYYLRPARVVLLRSPRHRHVARPACRTSNYLNCHPLVKLLNCDIAMCFLKLSLLSAFLKPW